MCHQVTGKLNENLSPSETGDGHYVTGRICHGDYYPRPENVHIGAAYRRVLCVYVGTRL